MWIKSHLNVAYVLFVCVVCVYRLNIHAEIPKYVWRAHYWKSFVANIVYCWTIEITSINAENWEIIAQCISQIKYFDFRVVKGKNERPNSGWSNIGKKERKKTTPNEQGPKNNSFNEYLCEHKHNESLINWHFSWINKNQWAKDVCCVYHVKAKHIKIQRMIKISCDRHTRKNKLIIDLSSMLWLWFHLTKSLFEKKPLTSEKRAALLIAQYYYYEKNYVFI